MRAFSHIYSDRSERTIAFVSKILSGTEKKYSQIDKKALAIIWAVKELVLLLFKRTVIHCGDESSTSGENFWFKTGIASINSVLECYIIYQFYNRSSSTLYFVKPLNMAMQTSFLDCQNLRRIIGKGRYHSISNDTN